MNILVKIILDEDGCEIDEPAWHLAEYSGGSDRVLCDGQVFGFGEGSAEYKTKETVRGGITCEYCMDKIKAIKAVKL